MPSFPFGALVLLDLVVAKVGLCSRELLRMFITWGPTIYRFFNNYTIISYLISILHEMPEFGEPRATSGRSMALNQVVLVFWYCLSLVEIWLGQVQGPGKRETCIDHKYGIKVNPHALSAYGHSRIY